MRADPDLQLPAFVQALQDVMAERARQVATCGWTADHDDRHQRGELASAAAAYAMNAAGLVDRQHGLPLEDPQLFGFPRGWTWKPKSPRRDLVRAAALILAEIERLDRADDG